MTAAAARHDPSVGSARAYRVWKNPTLALVVIVSTIALLYPWYQLFNDFQQWMVWNQAQIAKTIIKSAIYFLIALGASSGLALGEVIPNVRQIAASLLGGAPTQQGPPPPTV